MYNDRLNRIIPTDNAIKSYCLFGLCIDHHCVSLSDIRKKRSGYHAKIGRSLHGNLYAMLAEPIHDSDFSRIWISCEDNQFFDLATKQIKCLEDIDLVNHIMIKCLEDIDLKTRIAITCATIFDQTLGAWVLVPVTLKYSKGIVTVDSNGRVYPLADCLMCYSAVKTDFVYFRTISFLKLPTLEYDDKPDNYLELKGLISKLIVPSFITKDLIYESFLDDVCELMDQQSFVVAKFGTDPNSITRITILPFLFDFFDKNSPIFGGEGFGKQIGHPIEFLDSFKLIMKWMTNLLFRKEWPNIDELLKFDFDLERWKLVADYFGIECFVGFFTALIDYVKVPDK